MKEITCDDEQRHDSENEKTGSHRLRVVKVINRRLKERVCQQEGSSVVRLLIGRHGIEKKNRTRAAAAADPEEERLTARASAI